MTSQVRHLSVMGRPFEWSVLYKHRQGVAGRHQDKYREIFVARLSSEQATGELRLPLSGDELIDTDHFTKGSPGIVFVGGRAFDFHRGPVVSAVIRSSINEGWNPASGQDFQVKDVARFLSKIRVPRTRTKPRFVNL